MNTSSLIVYLSAWWLLSVEKAQVQWHAGINLHEIKWGYPDLNKNIQN